MEENSLSENDAGNKDIHNFNSNLTPYLKINQVDHRPKRKAKIVKLLEEKKINPFVCDLKLAKGF